MERKLFQSLCLWKENLQRKPLIINGARQVGKTWLLREFGRREYENVAYINCDNNPAMRNIFTDYNTERLLRLFSALTEQRIEAGKTLVILDEIQEIPEGLTALKYFAENAPEIHIAVAGSLLGLQTHQGTGYPVGKVDELKLYPLTFEEFLAAMGREQLLEILRAQRWAELSPLREVYIDALRQYYYVGGMPEAVAYYVATQDLQGTRSIQKRILSDYRQDFSKHIPSGLLAKVNLAWDAIPAQLAKENKKFVYGAVKKGSRAKDFEDAIAWLRDAGLIYRISRVRKITKPIKFYEDIDAFKLFVSDLGLLGAMSDVAAKDVLLGESVFKEYKGAFTEQYVAQMLIASGQRPYYYAGENSTAEIDFVIQDEDVYPIEVKAEENLRSKSLRTVLDRNLGTVGWRFSMSDYREQERMVNVPLYAVEAWIRVHEANDAIYL